MHDCPLILNYDEITLNSSGAATPTRSMHTIDTYLDAATDNCDTLTAPVVSGTLLILKQANSNRDITFRDGVGNLQLAGDFAMTHSHDMLTLISWGTNWFELSRSNNA
jgi:hypothetical protein